MLPRASRPATCESRYTAAAISNSVIGVRPRPAHRSGSAARRAASSASVIALDPTERIVGVAEPSLRLTPAREPEPAPGSHVPGQDGPARELLSGPGRVPRDHFGRAEAGVDQ